MITKDTKKRRALTLVQVIHIEGDDHDAVQTFVDRIGVALDEVIETPNEGAIAASTHCALLHTPDGVFPNAIEVAP